MNQSEQANKAELFRAMHSGPPLLLLPNAWDAISARIIVAAGFHAIATTSGGVAWALGYADGEAAPWDEVVAATARIARAVVMPVTADIETGYGDTPEAVGRSIGDIIAAGAVGVNLEDGLKTGTPPIRSLADATARIRAAREAARAAGVPIVINARTDLYIKNIGDGSPSVAELEALGVKRASTATAIPLMAMGLVRQLAEQLHATHRFDALNPAMTHPEAQQLFAPR